MSKTRNTIWVSDEATVYQVLELPIAASKLQWPEPVQQCSIAEYGTCPHVWATKQRLNHLYNKMYPKKSTLGIWYILDRRINEILFSLHICISWSTVLFTPVVPSLIYCLNISAFQNPFLNMSVEFPTINMLEIFFPFNIIDTCFMYLGTQVLNAYVSVISFYWVKTFIIVIIFHLFLLFWFWIYSIWFTTASPSFFWVQFVCIILFLPFISSLYILEMKCVFWKQYRVRHVSKKYIWTLS